MELEIDDNIYYLDNANDYPELTPNVMNIVIFDMYYNIIHNHDEMINIYSEEEIEHFYSFIRKYCCNVHKYRRSRAKLSQLLCLSFMIADDPYYVKSIDEFLFIKKIQHNFKNWFCNTKIKKKSMPTRV